MPDETSKTIPVRFGEIEYLALDDLHEVEDNPQEHDVEAIKRSIQEMGFAQPLIVDRDNRIVGGHGRKTALSELQSEGFVLDGKGVPVIRGDYSEKEAAVLLLALNRIQGYPDPMKLAAYTNRVLGDFDMELPELEVAGFTLPELQDIQQLSQLPDDMQSSIAVDQGIDPKDIPKIETNVQRFQCDFTGAQMDVLSIVLGYIRSDEPRMDEMAKQSGNDDHDANAIIDVLRFYAYEQKLDIPALAAPVDDGEDDEEDDSEE